MANAPAAPRLSPRAAVGYTRDIDYLPRIQACRNADLGQFVPWCVGTAVAGYVHRDRLPLVAGAAGPFATAAGQVFLPGADAAARSAALHAAVERLVALGELRPALGEAYPVLAYGGGAPLAQLDRTAVAWFGVRAAGVHLNGYVRTAQGLHLWVAERAPQRRSYAGHRDNMVAGGQSLGFTAAATLVKECHEEAGVPAELAAAAVAVGALAYQQQQQRSLKPDTLHCYDLELPAGFTPRAVDGEVARFELLPAAAVARQLRDGAPWKPNSALVALDWLLRHGQLDAELAPPQRLRLWQLLRGPAASSL